MRRQGWGRHTRWLVAGLLTAIGWALLAFWSRPADACIGEIDDSVHFNSSAPDFGTPPRRTPMGWWDANITSGGGVGSGEDPKKPYAGSIVTSAAARGLRARFEDSDLEEQRKTKVTNLRVDALIAERRGQWRKAESCYRQIAHITGWTGDVKDLLEILHRVEAMKTPLPTGFAAALQTYLQGMASDSDSQEGARSAFTTVYNDPAAGFLKERALYQLASVAYDWLDFPHAATLYQQLLRDFPKGEKSEPALMMVARCCTLPDMTESRRLETAQQAMDQLLKEFPRTRFRPAVLGLRARIHFLKRRYTDALWCYFALGDLESALIVAKAMPPGQAGAAQIRLLEGYLKRLTAGKNRDVETVREINRLRAELSPEEADRFAQDLVRRPELLAPYIYYRLYHCANTPSDLKHLTQLADTVVARYPNTALSPTVRVRLAEIYYQQKQYDKAVSWTSRALASDRNYDRALYVRGASEHKRKRYGAAIADLHTLLRTSKDNPLRHGAREELAVVCEAAGDLGGAADQYFALDYNTDVAYILDVRMTPAQIETYWRHAPEEVTSVEAQAGEGVTKSYSYTRRQLLAYTLGIHYLRLEKWAQATHWLNRVPRSVRDRFDEGRHKLAEKESPDALVAVRELSRLQGAVRKAGTSNARASALYRYASYYYTHGTLLLYNPVLWDGRRADSLSDIAYSSQEAKQDTLAVNEHSYRHDVYARAQALCLQIVKQYPRSPTAPNALYRAACASRNLANFNGWWRVDNKRRNHWDEAAHLMQELARRYPKSPLAHEARKYATVFVQEKKDISW